jgi:hypothetical protein
VLQVRNTHGVLPSSPPRAATWQVRNTHGVLGFAIAVTSASATPDHVEARAMRFLRSFVPSIGRMRKASYAANVAACVSSFLCDDTSLAGPGT